MEWFIFFMVFGVAGIVYVIQQATNSERENRFQEELQKESFFVSSFKEGVHTLENQSMIDKVLLIAARLGIQGSNNEIIKQLENSKALAVRRGKDYYLYEEDFIASHGGRLSRMLSHEKDELKQEIKKRFGLEYGQPLAYTYWRIGEYYYKSSPELKQKERNEQAFLEKYLPYRGREKRIEMLCDKRDELLQKLEGRHTINPNALQQKEHDWSVMGGLANGIAGPAAGVATAINYQQKNAQIRRDNAKVGAFVADINSAIEERIRHLKWEVEDCNKKIESSHSKLIGEESEQETLRLMDFLEFYSERVTVSQTGSVYISVNMSSSTSPTLYDGEVKARIDGFVQAELVKNGSIAGSAILTLPMLGLDESGKEIKGICTETSDAQAQYTINYKPIALWLIEP